MKKLFLVSALLFSFSALAEQEAVVFPQVYNYGTNVQVRIWNHTDRSVSCSGFVNLYYQSGARDSEYFYDHVSARFTSYRNIYPRRLNDRVMNVNHSISCF